MKTFITLTLAALMLIAASAAIFAGEDKKNAARTQVAAANQQLSIKLLRLRIRVQQTPPSILLVNQ